MTLSMEAGRMRKFTFAAALVLSPTLAHAQSAGAAANASTVTDTAMSHEALVRAGHTRPTDEEVRLGARLLGRGYSRYQIETVAHAAPADRSLVVAFETLSSLKTQGMTTTRAAAEVESRVSAHASDAELREFAGGADAGLRTDAAAKVGTTGINAAGVGVAGSVSGRLGRVLGRP
jgi:hypothetical protein